MRGRKNLSKEVLEYQPDAVEIEEKPVPAKVRWVLYVLVGTLVFIVVWAIVFKVDRIVVAEGNLLTTSPTIVVQPLNTAVVKSIEVQVGDIVERGQVLATLDSTFASADLSQLTKQNIIYGAQVRRIQAELRHIPFHALADEGEDGVLQVHLFRQRKMIYEKNRELNKEKVAALQAKLTLIKTQYEGKEKQQKILRDVEGTISRNPEKDTTYRLQLLEAQKNRFLVANEIDNLKAEEQVVIHELEQAKSEWHRFVEERNGELMEQEIKLRGEMKKIHEEISKAKRLHELVQLKAPESGVVLSMAERSVGSIIQQAEPFVTLVPVDSNIEVEAKVKPKDIGRIRTEDSARIKLDAFPFQKHGTLPGRVRVISEDSFYGGASQRQLEKDSQQGELGEFYKVRIRVLSTKLRNVPEYFRLMPGMKVRAEIKVGTRTIISYFLYPVIRAFDESLREP